MASRRVNGIDIKRVTANISDIMIAKIKVKDTVRIDVTWDCKERSLLIHQWYKLTESELRAFKDAFTIFFTMVQDNWEEIAA